jgi:SAM-dependent methyltransferase
MITTTTNESYIECWNQILTPKWVRFRHLLSGNGKIHSDAAGHAIDVRSGDRVLDAGCGFGETCLAFAEQVGPSGEVVGLDCTDTFLEIADRERRAAGATNLRYELGDFENHPLPANRYDVVFSRFGMMYCQSPVRALRNLRAAMAPGGRIYLFTWRRLADNPAWGAAEEIALELLPRPGDGAQTCGPGPFSMADPETNGRILEAAGFSSCSHLPIDRDACVGRTIDEAIDYQVQVGPAGYVIREAGDAGQRALPAIRSRLAELYADHARPDGSVWLPSASWLISASKRD